MAVTDKQQKRHRRENFRLENTFYLSLVFACLVFAAMGYGVVHWRRLHGIETNLWVGFPFNALILAVALARVFAIWVCRVTGASRESCVVERIERAPFLTDGRKLESVSFPRGISAYIVPICATGLVYCFTIFMLKCNCLEADLYYVPMISLAAATAILGWKNLRQPLVRADETGLIGCNSIGVLVKSVRWEEIESCSFVTKRDIWGKVASQKYIARNEAGKTLLTVSATEGRDWESPKLEEQQRQLTRFIRWKMTGEP